jgi:hypothetical protein
MTKANAVLSSQERTAPKKSSFGRACSKRILSAPRASEQAELFPDIAEPEGMSMRARGILTNGLRHEAMGDKQEPAGRTYAGQASWADPSIGKNCIECGFYSTEGLKKHRCLKYYALRQAWGAQFPSDATACRHFEPRPRQ